MLYTCILYSLPDYISHSEKIWHIMIVHGKIIVEYHVTIACMHHILLIALMCVYNMLMASKTCYIYTINWRCQKHAISVKMLEGVLGYVIAGSGVVCVGYSQ